MKILKAFLFIAVITLFALWLMPKFFPSEGGVLDSAEMEFRQLAVRMTLIRLSIVTTLGVFFWKPIADVVSRYFSLDVSNIQGRVLAWYLAAEMVILSSVWGGP